MTQFAARPEEDFRTKMLNGERRRLQERLNAEARNTTILNNVEYDDNFQPTFTTPDMGLVGAIGARNAISGLELESVGVGLIRSFPERFATGGNITPMKPYTLDGSQVLIDGELVPSTDVSIEKLYEVMDPVHRNLLLDRGKDVQTLQQLQISNAAEFFDWWKQFAQYDRASRKLEKFKEDHPWQSGVSYFGAMAGNVADPLTLMTLAGALFTGGLSLSGTAATQSTRAVGKAAGKRLLASGAAKVFRGTVDPIFLLEQGLTRGAANAARTRILVTLAGVGYGSTYGFIGSAGAQTLMNELGEQDPNYETGWLEAGLGGAIGGALTYWGTRGVFKRHNSGIGGVGAATDGAASSLAVARHLHGEERLGKTHPINPADFANAEAVESYLSELFPPHVVKHVTGLLFKDGRDLSDIDLEGLAKLLSEGATALEIEDFLTNPQNWAITSTSTAAPDTLVFPNRPKPRERNLEQVGTAQEVVEEVEPDPVDVDPIARARHRKARKMIPTEESKEAERRKGVMARRHAKAKEEHAAELAQAKEELREAEIAYREFLQDPEYPEVDLETTVARNQADADEILLLDQRVQEARGNVERLEAEDPAGRVKPYVSRSQKAKLERAYQEQADALEEARRFQEDPGDLPADLDAEEALDNLDMLIKESERIERRVNEAGRAVAKLEEELGEDLASAYRKRAEIDRDFDEFLTKSMTREADDLDPTLEEIDDILGNIKSTDREVQEFARRYAAVEKTIRRLEGIGELDKAPTPSKSGSKVKQRKPTTQPGPRLGDMDGDPLIPSGGKGTAGDVATGARIGPDDEDDYLGLGKLLEESERRQAREEATGKVESVVETQTNTPPPKGVVVGQKRTRYSILRERVMSIADQLQDVSEMSAKDIRKLTVEYERAVDEWREHIESNFSLEGSGGEGIGKVMREHLKDAPLSALPNDEARAVALYDILTSKIDSVRDKYNTRSMIPYLHAFGSSKIGKYLAGNLFTGLKMKGRTAIASSDTEEMIIGYLHGLIDNKGFHNSEILKNANGSAVRSAQSRQIMDETRYITHIKKELARVRKANKDLTDREIFDVVVKSIVKGTDVPEPFKALRKVYKDYIESVGTRGVEAGTFRNKLDNYFNFTVAQSYDRVKAERAVIKAFKRVYGALYGYDETRAAHLNFADDTTPVNYKALVKAGYLKDDFTSKVDPLTGKPYFETLPKTLADLDPDIKAEYIKKFPKSLEEDAKAFFLKRSNERLDPDAETRYLTEDLVNTRHIDRKSRQVADQEIYLDKDVLDSGFIDLDLHSNAMSYHRGTGYNVNKDAALSELFGEKVTWGVLKKALSLMKGDNSKELIKNLEKLDDVTGGRFRTTKDGARLAAVINNIVGAVIAGKLPISILPLETAGSYLRNFMTDRQLLNNIAIFVDGFRKTFNKEELQHAGILHESDMNQPRMLANLDETIPDDVANNLIVNASRKGSYFFRTVLLERFWTAHSRSMIYGTTFAKMFKIRRKLDKLLSIPQGLIEEKEFRRIARELGIDVGELKMLQNYGLLEKEMVEAAIRAREIDPKSLRGDNRLLAVAQESGDEGIMELWRKLNNMAREDAETFVARPTRGDVNVTDSPVANLIFSLTSFVNSFYTGTLSRVGQTPYTTQIGFFGFIMGAQVATNIMRDILYRGESVDTVLEKWEEDPTKELALAISMLPLQGSFGLLPGIGFGYATGGDPGRVVDQLFSSASPGILASTVDGAYRGLSKALKGEELSDADWRRIENGIPGLNSSMLRLFQEANEGFEADSDR